MNFFEQELRKMFENDKVFYNTKFVGRICIGRINKDLIGRIEFVTLGTAEHYEGLKVSILNNNQGLVDSVTVRFSELFGKKKVNNPNFNEGVVPHIWAESRNTDWYVYHLMAKDYKDLFNEVNNYVEVFRNVQIAEKEDINLQI